MPEDPETPSRMEDTINAFLTSFSKFSVIDIMLNRADVEYIKTSTKFNDIAKKFKSTGLNKLLVCDKDLDNVKGYITIHDFLLSNNLESIVKFPLIIPDSINLANLLELMKTKHTDLAIVIDEFGGTDGVVTIEDLYQKIFSLKKNFVDEGRNTMTFNARAKIEEIESLLGISLRTSKDEDDYDTIAGMLMSKTQSVPQIGSKISIAENVVVEILDSNNRAIKKVKFINP